MLSIETSSYDVSLEQLSVSNPNVRIAMHFLMPDLDIPFHLHGFTKQGEQRTFSSNTRLFGVLTVMDVLEKKVHRRLFVPQFNTIQEHRFENAIVHSLLHTTIQHDNLAYGIENIVQNLNNYLKNAMKLLMQTPASDPRLEKIHSLCWHFPMFMNNTQLELYVPYVSLVCRGDVLVNNIDKNKWISIQTFFIKELMLTCKENGLMPSEFIKISMAALQDTNNQPKVYLHLANMFSTLVHKHVKYMTDYQATGLKDSVSINNFDGILYADCEDMAQASYDLMRVFRKVFPSQKSDLRNKATTFAYHVSAWLNNSHLGIVQGATGKAYDKKLHNHIWTCILPYESFPVFVEGTSGKFKPSTYRYLIRFWQRRHGCLKDYLLINSFNGTYGIDCNIFLQQKNINQFIEQNSFKCQTSSVIKDIHFAANLQVDTFHLLDHLINSN